MHAFYSRSLSIADLLMISMVVLVIFLVINNSSLSYRYLIEDKVVIMMIIIFVIYVLAKLRMRVWNKKGLSRGFEEVKDLVRGTIVAEVS